MPTLEIAVDARGVEQGLRQANKALDETAQKADRAEREVKQMGQASHVAGRDMGAAFAATGGGLAITHGLEGISSGFRSGNSAMAAFAASQALLDLGRFAEDMKAVTAATGGATTVFGTLGTIMKAHPLMTIATVLAAAAGAMALFGGETEEAADEMERLGEAMQKAQASQYVQQVLGLSQEPGVRGRQAAVIAALEQYERGGLRTVGQFARELDITPAEIQRRLMQSQQMQQLMGPAMLGRRVDRLSQFGDVPLPRRAAEFIIKQIYAELLQEGRRLPATVSRVSGQAAPGQPFTFDFPAAGAPFTRGGVMYPQGYGTGEMLMRRPGDPGTFGYQPPSGPGLSGGMGMVGYGINMGMQTLTQMQAFANEQALEAKQAMDELVAQGQQFGQTIGDAFFRVAEGTMTARQAMAELVRQFAQMAAQSAFRGIGGQIFGSFAPTRTQTTANNLPSGEMVP